MSWRRVNEKRQDNFTLKWTETKSAISYSTFKEGTLAFSPALSRILAKLVVIAKSCWRKILCPFSSIRLFCLRWTNGEPFPELSASHQQDGFAKFVAKLWATERGEKGKTTQAEAERLLSRNISPGRFDGQRLLLAFIQRYTEEQKVLFSIFATLFCFLSVVLLADSTFCISHYLTCLAAGDIWICKPTGRNQGKGIYLVRDKNEIKRLCENHDNNQKPGKPRRPLNRIIQKWVSFLHI